MAQIHARLDEIRREDGPDPRGTIGWLLATFLASPTFNALAAATQADYRYCADVARGYKTRYGPLGAILVSRLSPAAIQNVIDAIAESGRPSKANHLLRFLRRTFSWGIQRGHCTSNPARGVEQAKEAKTFRMPEAAVLDAVIRFARARGALPSHSKGAVPAYLWAVIVLAYRCRLRSIEVLTLTEAQVDDVGIVTARRKGSRDNHVRWSPELRDAVEAARAYRSSVWERRATPSPIQPGARRLFVSQTGGVIASSTLKTAWRRLMDAAIADNVLTQAQRFTLHGLKHRGVTDTKGNMQEAAGHVSPAMTHRYNHEVPVVDPAGR